MTTKTVAAPRMDPRTGPIIHVVLNAGLEVGSGCGVVAVVDGAAVTNEAGSVVEMVAFPDADEDSAAVAEVIDEEEKAPPLSVLVLAGAVVTEGPVIEDPAEVVEGDAEASSIESLDACDC